MFTLNFSSKKVVLFMALSVTLSVSGCRQAPSEDTAYYERELDQFRRKQQRMQQAEKPLKDGYPWRSNKTESCLPCRIKTMEKDIKVEIDYLHETVRGRKKTRLRLRD